MSKSATTTESEWLHNEHAGEILFAEFMEPLALDSAGLAKAIAVPTGRLDAVVTGTAPIDAELDLRLTRYFRMSEGFFMRLQVQHDLLEAKRRLNGQLEMILPRAA